MRIVAAGIGIMAKKLVIGDALPDGYDRHAIAEIDEEFLHLSFQIQTVPQHQISLNDLCDVGSGLPIGMGIDPRPHQRNDVRTITGHLLSGIADHRRRRDNAQLVGRSTPHTAEGDNNHRQNKSAQFKHRSPVAVLG